MVHFPQNVAPGLIKSSFPCFWLEFPWLNSVWCAARAGPFLETPWAGKVPQSQNDHRVTATDSVFEGRLKT